MPAHIAKHLTPASLDALATAVREKLTDLISDVTIVNGQVRATVLSANLIKMLKKLRDGKDFKFTQLIDITAVDWTPDDSKPQDFCVVYQLLSLTLNQRLMLYVWADGTKPMPSVTELFNSANWYEREVYDMFGLEFAGHPDLRRLLTDYDFDGHPLRKDFPVEGKVEVYYDTKEERVAYKPVDLPQQWRDMHTDQRWQAMTGNSDRADTVFDEGEFKR